MLSAMSLKYRIAATVFVLEAVMLFLVLWLTLSASLAASRAQLAENEENVLTLLSGLGLSALITEEYADVQPYLERVAQNAHVLHALLEQGGRVVASSVSSDIGKPPRTLPTSPKAIGAPAAFSDRAARPESCTYNSPPRHWRRLIRRH